MTNLQIESAESRAFRAFREVIRITSELFGEVRIKESSDPECADDKYVVLVVRAEGSTQELLSLEEKWVERIRPFAKNWTSFRLSLRPIE
jgi:hypothetical protein